MAPEKLSDVLSCEAVHLVTVCSTPVAMTIPQTVLSQVIELYPILFFFLSKNPPKHTLNRPLRSDSDWKSLNMEHFRDMGKQKRGKKRQSCVITGGNCCKNTPKNWIFPQRYDWITSCNIQVKTFIKGTSFWAPWSLWAFDLIRPRDERERQRERDSCRFSLIFKARDESHDIGIELL